MDLLVVSVHKTKVFKDMKNHRGFSTNKTGRHIGVTKCDIDHESSTNNL